LPDIRPFRALRYDRSTVTDPAQVVAPPYDVLGPADQERLLARHPANAVRLDLPREEPGDEADDRYRRAARTLAAWRSDGTLHKDPHPSIYVYEQTYRVPGTGVERCQRGFFARLRLEPLTAGSGVVPHERTLAAPREDRYKLLRATGVNTSPIVALYDAAGADSGSILATVVAGSPDLDVVDDDGVRHRTWAVPANGPAAESVEALLAVASRRPVTIADGHHRYETALRYRDERRMSRSCEEDPAFDYVLTLFVDIAGQPLTVLPTHRIVRALGDAATASLVARLDDAFVVQRGVSPADLRARFEAAALDEGGAGRFGLWTREGGALLTARPSAFGSSPGADRTVGRLDVSLLATALERLAGIDAEALAAGRIAYTRSAAEAIDAVDAGLDGADAAFLLEPTPVAAVLAVAADGDVMPQKSTYFYPKALTGLVFNPHEW
jgi:uncharacterized protein (DUF1015 family)